MWLARFAKIETKQVGHPYFCFSFFTLLKQKTSYVLVLLRTFNL
jgi:hypothetical protein